MVRFAGFSAVVLLLAGCLVLARHGWRVQERQSAPAITSVVSTVAGPAPLASEVQRLRAQVAVLQAEVHASRTAPAAPDRAPAVREEPERQQPPLEPAQVQERYQSLFEAEVVDTNWARDEERSVVGFFGSEANRGAHLDKVECRESMCRILVRFDDPGARSGFIAQMGSPPFDHGGFYRTDEATGDVTLFTAREGRALPDVQPDVT
jgi:hypothetical protein